MKLDRTELLAVLVLALAACAPAASNATAKTATVGSTTLTSASTKTPAPRAGKVQRADETTAGAGEADGNAEADEAGPLTSPKDEPRKDHRDRRDAGRPATFGAWK
jgi:hypothetical protein